MNDSFRYPQGFKLEQESNKVFLPKIGWVKYRNSRQVIGDVKNMTISRKGGYWYVSIQTEYETELKRHSSTSMIGVDMGVTRFATLSDGSYVEPLNSFRKLSKKLAFEQRKCLKKSVSLLTGKSRNKSLPDCMSVLPMLV
nr:transposase [Nitrosomonas cryotolerans]